MASARDIKRRIKSVQSTEQITKAMKMVSAAKLRKAQAAVLAVRPFTHKIDQVILHLSDTSHPYLQARAEVRSVCYVVLGSDHGLCGGFNANLYRFLEHTLAAEQRPFSLIVLGRRAQEYCGKRGWKMEAGLPALSDNPDFREAQALSEFLTKAFCDEIYDEIHLVYSEFKSAMLQAPRVMQLLPVPMPSLLEEEENMFAEGYLFEPDKETVLAELLPQYVDYNVFCTLQEVRASEHGARMTAMSSATDNAVEMIHSLTLSLNRARQAAITTEISEIVGGAAALS